MSAEIAPFRVKTVRLSNGERFPAIRDGNGVLAYAPALYGGSIFFGSAKRL